MIDVGLYVRPLSTRARTRRLSPIATAPRMLRSVIVVVPVAIVTLVARHGGAIQRVAPVAPLLLRKRIVVAIVTVAVLGRLPGATGGGRAHNDWHLER